MNLRTHYHVYTPTHTHMHTHIYIYTHMLYIYIYINNAFETVNLLPSIRSYCFYYDKTEHFHTEYSLQCAVDTEGLASTTTWAICTQLCVNCGVQRNHICSTCFARQHRACLPFGQPKVIFVWQSSWDLKVYESRAQGATDKLRVQLWCLYKVWLSSKEKPRECGQNTTQCINRPDSRQHAEIQAFFTVLTMFIQLLVRLEGEQSDFCFCPRCLLQTLLWLCVGNGTECAQQFQSPQH